MSQVDEIKSPIKANMEEFERHYRRLLVTDIPHIDRMVDFILSGEGKHMRPMLLFLTAALHGDINEVTYISASLIEITHTASLVHDDVVDEAYRRRARWSVNALWRSHQAVLVGDFLLARSIRKAAEHKLYKLIETMSCVIEAMSAGELMQAGLSERLSATKEEYLEVIRSKTALLLGSAAEAGASSVGADEEACERMRHFGELVGMAFQIKDDILDYSPAQATGKPAYGDIRERKMTLPLIEALEDCDKKSREKILYSLSRAADDHKALEEVRDFVIERGGLEKAGAVMESIAEEACSLLEGYDDSPAKQSLLLLADYAVTRKK